MKLGLTPLWVMHFYAKNVKHNWHWDYGGGNGGDLEVTAGAHTTMTLYTGGKSGSVKKHLFRVRGSADEYGKSKDGGWGFTPVKPVPKTAIRMLGKYADQFGEVVKSLKDNDEVNLGLNCPGKKHYNAGAGIVSKGCSPVKLTFQDGPGRLSSDWPCSWNAKLELVCAGSDDVSDPNYTNYTPSGVSITYGFDIDISGHVTLHNPVGAGHNGDCYSIVLTTYQAYPGRDGAIQIAAYYIGCCDERLSWVQTILPPTPPLPGKSDPPYNDHDATCPVFPDGPYYLVPYSSAPDHFDWIDDNTKDYSPSPDYPMQCLP